MTNESSQGGAASESGGLVAALCGIFEQSDEPLPLPRILPRLPEVMRPESLQACLRRQVAARVFFEYPRYRSQHRRYWDRPIGEHVVELVRSALRERPLSWPELRSRLPAYVRGITQKVLREQVAKGSLFVHPRHGRRGADRFALTPPEIREYVQDGLHMLFQRLQRIGFAATAARETALELLHTEVWADPNSPPAAREPVSV
jgi:hypothetical protein